MSKTKLAVVFAFLLTTPLSGTEIDDGESTEFRFCTYFDHQTRLARGGLKAVVFGFAQPLQGWCLSAGQAEYPGNVVKDNFRATAFRNGITEIILPAQTPQCR